METLLSMPMAGLHKGLPLAQLPLQTAQPTVEEIISVDPMEWINKSYQRATQQIQEQFAQNQAAISRQTNNRLQMLQREYNIEEAALQQKYKNLPKDEQNRTREWQEFNDLRKKYLLAAEKARGKITPDLQDLESQRQQTLQQLQWQQTEKLIQLKQLDRLVQEGKLLPEYAAQEKYALAGHNIPVTNFKGEDLYDRIIATGMALTDAEERGDEDTAAALRIKLEEYNTQLAGVDPDAAKAVRKRTTESLAGLESRKKSRVREPKTIAEGIRQIKNTSAYQKQYTPLSVLKAEKITKQYRRNKRTGETQVSYDSGQTWQKI